MRRLILAVAAATSLATTTPALAQDVGLRSFPKLDLSGFSGDPTALPKAVADIESSSGGRVLELRYNNVDGVPGYDVVVAKGQQVQFLRLGRPAAGLVEISEKAVPPWMLDRQSQRNAKLGETAKVALADAIRTAEGNKGGAPAVAAGIARSAANPTSDVHAYNISILSKDGIQRRVAVDSQTGLVIADPSALSAW